MLAMLGTLSVVLLLCLLPSATAFEAHLCDQGEITLFVNDKEVQFSLFAYKGSSPGFTSIFIKVYKPEQIVNIKYYDLKALNFVDYYPFVQVTNTDYMQFVFGDSSNDTYLVQPGVGLLNGTVYVDRQQFDGTSVYPCLNYGSTATCCAHFILAEYDIPQDVCTAFSTQTRFHMQMDNTSFANFHALYTIEDGAIKARVDQFQCIYNEYFLLFGMLFSNQTTNSTGETLNIPLLNQDSVHAISVGLQDGSGHIFYDGEAITVTQRAGNLYWGLEAFPTQSQPCITSSQQADITSNNLVTETTVCCTNFRPNPSATPISVTQPASTPAVETSPPNPVPVYSTLPNTLAPTISTQCAEYRSRTIVNKQFNIDFLQLSYKFSTNSLAVSVINFTSGKPNGEGGQLEVYSKDTFSQSCLTNSIDPESHCVFRLSNTKKYEFSFRTTTYPDGFNMFQAEEENRVFVLPQMNPCHIEDNLLNGGGDNSPSASTEICCIMTPNGPWPGKSRVFLRTLNNRQM